MRITPGSTHDIVINELGIDTYRRIWEDIELACSLEYAIDEYYRKNDVQRNNNSTTETYTMDDLSILNLPGDSNSSKSCISLNLDKPILDLSNPKDRCINVTNNQYKIPTISPLKERTKKFNQNNNKAYSNSNLIKINLRSENSKQIKNTPKTKPSLEITYQNVSGIRSRTHTFYENIISQDQDIICITESWLTPDIFDAEIIDPRYQVFRLDIDASVLGKTRGGGLLLAIKTNLKPEIKQEFCVSCPTFEILWVEVNLGFSRLNICLLYLAHPVNENSVELLLNHLQENTKINTKSLLILGDFNVPHFPFSDLNLTTQDPLAIKVVNFISQYGFTSFNNIPNNNNRTLDLVLFRANNNFNKNKSHNLYISRGESLLNTEDRHHPTLNISIQYERKNKNLIKAKSHKTNIKDGYVSHEDENSDFINLGCKNYNFRKADTQVLCTAVNNVDWSPIFSCDCPNASLAEFYKILYGVFNNNVPVKSDNHNQNNRQIFPFWWSPQTIQALKNKEKLRKYNSKHNILNSSELKTLKKECKKSINEDHKKYIEEVENDISTGKKKLWTYYKMQKKNDTRRTYTFKNETITHPKNIADAFGEHFHSVYSEENPTYRCNFYDEQHADEIDLFKIEDSDIIKSFKDLPSNKGPGADNIPPTFLKLLSSSIIAPLLHIFNTSLKQKVFPTLLKNTLITPVPKKSGTNSIENHRPIAQLSGIAKIFEICIFNKINTHVYHNICTQQHGFVTGRSTTSNLIEFQHSVVKDLNTSTQVDVIYTDILKCYDKINHDILLNKMYNFGFSLDILEFFASYLKDRKQNVIYKTEDGTVNFSKSYVPKSSVPQGSKLSCLLFIIVIDEIGKAIRHSSYLLYADDFKLFRKISNSYDCLLLQQDLDNVVKWLTENKLTLHKEKCEIMSFTTSKNPTFFEYTIENYTLKKVSVKKDLGVTFQPNLNFDIHISNISNDASKMLGFIQRQCRYFRNIDTILLLYKTLVRSKCEYASVIWDPQTQGKIKLIEDIQSRFVRYLFWKFNGFYPTYPNNISSKLLCEQLQLPSLKQRRDTTSLSLVYDLCNNKSHCPTAIQAISYTIPVVHLRSRNSQNLFYINPRDKSIYNQSTIPRILNLYNSFNQNLDLGLSKTLYIENVNKIFNIG